MATQDTVKYKINKVENLKLKNVVDCIAIEEPLEIIIRYFSDNKWIDEPLMVTMRTPGDDYSLVSGILFSEGIIYNKEDIKNITAIGNNKSKYKIDNSLLVTLGKGNKLNLKNLQRHFMVNSSCGVCGKGALNAIEISYAPKIIKSAPIVDVSLITKLPNILIDKQKQFANTGGVHASGLINTKGDLIHLAEDVGRHNALDKLIGYIRYNNILEVKNHFVMCSGRLGFDIIQKIVMSDIGMVVGIGAPTSLALDLAKRFNITLIGFIKKKKYNIYNGAWRIENNS